MSNPAPPAAEAADLLPVRMLNEYAYCPRLFYLMHVQGRWADNVYTVEGRQAHRKVDKLSQVLPDAGGSAGKAASREAPAADAAGQANGEGGAEEGDEPPEIATSVSLASEALGLTAKLDLVSTADNEAVPVERKRGRVPDNPERSWEPERVQLMAQGLLLREHEYLCDHGMLYFAKSRTRVEVPFTPALEARTRELMAAARETERAPEPPPPLEDSPKCHGCSLVGICMPDETRALAAIREGRSVPDIRRLYPARDRALPFYVQEQGARVGKSRRTLLVTKDGEEVAKARFKDTSQLVLCGNVAVSAQAIHALCEASIPIVHVSTGNWFYGMTAGGGVKNGFARAAQYRAADDPRKRLALAKAVVAAKGANQRTLLRRNATPRPANALDAMARHLAKADAAKAVDALRGMEGAIAAEYFKHFGSMFKQPELPLEWDFAGRNRRPPADPVNALLSFGYALLAKECTSALLGEGLDPWWGLFHQPRHGRPALALDLMEEFRAVVTDSAVLTAVNTGMVKKANFQVSSAGCVMKPKARKAFIQAYEARLDQLVTHPLFDYRCSWRAVVRLQARLLGRWLRGEIPDYQGFVTR